jgi:hypothetical protein
MQTDITSMLRLNDWAGRIVLAFYGVGTAIVAILNLQGLIFAWIGLLSILLLWLGLAILARPDQEPFRLSSTIAVIGIVAAVASISSWNIADVVDPGYATWPLGAMTFLLFVLALRGRRGWAWIGFGVLAAIYGLVGVLSAQDAIMVINNVTRQAGTLLIGTLFALVLRRSSQTITAIQANQLTRSTVAAASAAATRERAAQNARLERDARPALERILQPEPLSPAEQQHFQLLEATLRDGIRATGYSSERIAAATREARERGVTVVLLDDRGSELVDGERDLVEAALLEQLTTTARDGAITARLSPHDRDELATIVVEEGGEYRRVVVTYDGAEVTHL